MALNRMEVPCEPGSVRAARDFVRGLLPAGAPPTCVDDVVLLTSEVVSNAIRHARSDVELRVECRAEGVKVGVVDFGAGEPHVQRAGPLDDSGRGLALVERLSRRWGVDRLRHGKLVWFEVEFMAGSSTIR